MAELQTSLERMGWCFLDAAVNTRGLLESVYNEPTLFWGAAALQQHLKHDQQLCIETPGSQVDQESLFMSLDNPLLSSVLQF